MSGSARCRHGPRERPLVKLSHSAVGVRVGQQAQREHRALARLARHGHVAAHHARELDGALQAADGYYRILGRIDDVINVAGHRLGTKEIESASLLVEEVAEAAVIPARDEIKGKVPDLHVSLKPGQQPSEEIRKRVENSVIREIGPIARPRRVVIVPDMPKTRSGKIMRRVLAAISNNEDAGDISTLANPEIVDEIRKLKF
jgi:acetyl-CoA synthetase